MSKELTGLVLAGGRSTRLGTDKARIKISGCDMLGRSMILAQQFCGQVYVSGRDPLDHGIEAPWIADETPGQGPIGGILTCLERLGTPLLVLACDLPLLDQETVARLVDHRKKRPKTAQLTTFRQKDTGYIESLVAIYEPGAAPYLRHALAEGVHKLSAAVPEQARHHLHYTHDEASVFFNLNRPADLAMLRRLEAMQSEANRAAAG